MHGMKNMDSAKDKSKQKLSGIFSQSLCLSGTSSYDTLLAKNKTLVEDFLFCSLSSNILKQYTGGSSAEGTTTNTSDVDCMMVVPDVIVQSSIADTSESCGHVFLLDTTKSRPGYAKLKLHQLQDTDYQLFDGYGTTIHEMLEETDEGVFLSSEKFVNFFVSIPDRIGMSTGYIRHGPCATAEHTDVHGYISSEPGFALDRDIAHALAYTTCHEEVNKWVTRERLLGWPAQDCIETISKQTCFVVPIGDTSSTYFTLEWRISFILGERELVWSFNDTQLHCYVTLKKILKTYLDPLAPDQLSSYNLKTVIFWLSEENGLSMWREENLIYCVEACLDRLDSCVEERRLSHYFNLEANLLGHKFKDTFQRELVMQKIKEIKSDIIFFVVECLPPELNWPGLWKQCEGDQEQLVERSRTEPTHPNEKYSTELKKSQVLKLYKILFNILLQLVTQNEGADSLLRQMVALQNDPPSGVDTIFTDMLEAFLDLRFAMVYVRQIKLRDHDEFQRYIDSLNLSIDKVLKQTSKGVLNIGMAGTLYLATVHQFVGDFQKSIQVITAYLQQHRHLVYPCWCSTYVGIRLDRDMITKPESHITLQGPEERTYVAFDAIFSYKDAPCVAYPVQFECALAEFDVNRDDFVVIHPCVYTYFLLCKGYLWLKNYPAYRETLTRLQIVVDETRGGLERYHALNLLGYSYVLVGQFNKGFRCYKESLQETRDLPGVSNAAAYHVAIMLLQYFEE